MAGAGNSKRRRLNVEGEIREVRGGAEGEFGVLSFFWRRQIVLVSLENV